MFNRILIVLLGGLGVTGIIVGPLSLHNQYYLQILMDIGVNIILTLGLNIITGLGGQLSLCQGAFFGIGAYACALLVMKAGLSFWLAWPIAAVGTGALGLLVGVPALRLRGHYLGMLTLAFAMIVSQVIANWDEVTRGPAGIINIPWPSPIVLGSLNVSVSSRENYYVFVVISVVALTLLAWAIQRSRFGMSLLAIREDEVAADIMGINTRLCKVLAFGLSAFFGAAAGGLFAHFAKMLTPDEFGLLQSVNILMMLVVGGAGSVLGATIGATVVTILPEALRAFGDYRLVAFGSILVLVIMFMPRGIAGLLKDLGRRRVTALPDLILATALRTRVPAAKLQRPIEPGDLLVVEHISKRFRGLTALEDVSLKVGVGEILGLIGPNGSGKTTLINVISGAYGPTGGTVSLAGETMTSKAPYIISGAGITRTFQKIRLFKELTVADNVATALLPSRIPKALGWLWTGRIIGRSSEMHEQSCKLLKEVGLLPRRDDIARNLSYGEQRMLEIARALATDPRVILLDEPAAGLSAIDVDVLRGVILRIKEQGISVIVVDHHTAFLMNVADRIVVLKQGSVIFDGLPAAARRDQGVIDAYLGTAAHA